MSDVPDSPEELVESMSDGLKATFVVHANLLFDQPPGEVTQEQIADAIADCCDALMAAAPGIVSAIGGIDVIFMSAGGSPYPYHELKEP